jgi:TolB-like protein
MALDAGGEEYETILYLYGIVGSDRRCPGVCPGDGRHKRSAENSSQYLVGRISKGSKVVILNFQSEFTALTDYIIDELTMYLVNDGNLTVVDRQNLEVIRQEMNFQMSGEVSDESAQEIGRKLGAQTIISGTITPLGDVYHLRVRAIAVETAAIQGMQNTNVAFDSTMAALTNTTDKKPPKAAVKPPSNNSRAGTASGEPADFSLDEKSVFAISATGMLGTGWGAGEPLRYGKDILPDCFFRPQFL